MIDTVILKIAKDKIKVANPSLWHTYGKSAYYEKWIRNTSVMEKKQGIYRPRLTGLKRYNQPPYVRIEFSCSKIVYGNNICELDEQSFPLLLNKLKQNLSEMGVAIQPNDLADAEVTAFHPSKNIPLADGYTSKYVIKQISKINLSKVFDFNKADYRNNGACLQAYTNTHAIVFYDKIADINKPTKRAIDKDQLHLSFDKLDLISSLELLRMEVRLCKKRKITSLLKALELPEKPSFKGLFANKLCQRILTNYWEGIIENNRFIYETVSSSQTVLRNILRNSIKTKLKDAIYLTSLHALSKDEGGIRGLRQIIEKDFSARSWYKVSADLKKVNQMSINRRLHGWVEQIDQSLKDFKPNTPNLECKEK
jgi:hypothetical protein